MKRLVSRWARPKFYACAHDDCPYEAVRVTRGCATETKTHNCCGGDH